MLLSKEIWTFLTLFGQRDLVVLQEDDLQAVSHHRVVVDDVPDGRDQLDDHLSGMVTWSSLKTKGNKSI